MANRRDNRNVKNDILLTEWVKRLGLTDWRIELQPCVTPNNMAVDEGDGCASFVESTKTAVIQILDPLYYEQNLAIVPFDYEEILVHELLHLKLCLLSDNNDDFKSRYVHQILDDLARAFVSAKRYGLPQSDADTK